MEAKQRASELQTNHRRNQNMHRNKLKRKHNHPKLMGFSKSSAQQYKLTSRNKRKIK